MQNIHTIPTLNHNDYYNQIIEIKDCYNFMDSFAIFLINRHKVKDEYSILKKSNMYFISRMSIIYKIINN